MNALNLRVSSVKNNENVRKNAEMRAAIVKLPAQYQGKSGSNTKFTLRENIFVKENRKEYHGSFHDLPKARISCTFPIMNEKKNPFFYITSIYLLQSAFSLKFLLFLS